MSDIVGLFPINYRTSGLPGAPTLALQLLVSTPDRKITGVATVTQAVNPPLVKKFHVAGVYSIMTVMPKITHYQIKLGGVLFDPEGLDLKSLSAENNKLFSALLVVGPDWEKGEATYTYLGHEQPIHQPVEAFQNGLELTTRAA